LSHKNSRHRGRWPRIAAFLALTAFVVPIAYGASPTKKEPPKRDNEFASLGIVKIGRSEPAHDFVLNDVQGNSVRLSALRGRVVFVNFWATWCPPCRQEMPSMDRLYRELKDSGLAMVAIDVKESKKEVSDFMRELRLSFPALLDTDGNVSRRYGTVGLPNTYIVDRTGKLIGHKPGGKNWATSEMIASFQRLLGDRGAPGPLIDGEVGPLNSPVLPSLLYVKSSGVSVYGQQDSSSEAVARPSRGEKLYPLGKASMEGESWYMVKTEQGLIGWIRRDDVEEHSDAKRP
jgi:thiol-disulfide isomerase/thioredoxin